MDTTEVFIFLFFEYMSRKLQHSLSLVSCGVKIIRKHFRVKTKINQETEFSRNA